MGNKVGKKSFGDRIADVIIYLVFGVFALACIFPIYYIFINSVSNNDAVARGDVLFWPVGFHVQNYLDIIDQPDIGHAIVNTLIRTFLGTFLSLMLTSFMGYAFTRNELWHRKIWYRMLTLTMYFGAGLIPTYLLYNQYRMLDTVWVLILPLIFSPYNMLVMKSFLQSSIPVSLEESAFLDGAGYFRILFKIVLPLSKPIIATLLLFYSVGRWNAYGDNMYYIKLNEKLKMIQYLLYQMVTTANEAQTIAFAEGSAQQTNPEVVQSAAIMVTTLPILVIYPFVQKHFVKGAMIGSVKG